MLTLAIIAAVLASMPVFMGLLRGFPRYRPWAFAALGAMLFLSDNLQLNGWIVGWPIWNGFVRGILITPADALALALVLTRRPVPARLPFWGVLAVYGTILTLSLLSASIPVATMFAIWQFGRVLLLFTAIGGEAHRPEMRGGLLAGLALGLMLQAGVVVSQKLGGVVQAPGTMPHQNILGMMTELALFPLIAALLGGDRRKVLLVGIAAALVIVAGGGSRAATAFAGGGIVMLTLLSLARRATPVKMRIVGLGVAAMAVATPLAILTLKDRFGNSSMVTQEEQRSAFRPAAQSMAADHPFGVGANLYVLISNKGGYAARAGVDWNETNRSKPVHDAYLLARAETGWLGEFAFIAMLVVPMIAGLRYAYSRREGPGGEVALGASLGLAVNLVHNNFEYAAFTYNVLGLLMVNFALIAGVLRASRLAKAAAPARPRPVSERLGPLVPAGLASRRAAD